MANANNGCPATNFTTARPGDSMVIVKSARKHMLYPDIMGDLANEV